MQEDNYTVVWTKRAIKELLTFWDVDHDSVFIQSKRRLCQSPLEVADKVAHYENYKFNGSLLKIVRNVVIVYSIDDDKKTVRINACLHTRTGEVAKILYGIKPPFTND